MTKIQSRIYMYICVCICVYVKYKPNAINNKKENDRLLNVIL